VSRGRELTVRVDQSGAVARGDIVAGNKIETHHHSPGALGIVEQLLKKFQEEVAANEQVRHTIEALAHYYNKRSVDGIDGLKSKLDVAGRGSEYVAAIEKKEMFAKVLERWALYASAQEIFVHLLARADHEFNYIIYPQIANLSHVQINQLVTDKIVAPTVIDCGATVFSINHGTALGMVYWLADQCFVRWHQ
jgi:hypothetical protein